MRTGYWAACPDGDCGWVGDLSPSADRGGLTGEVVPTGRAWFCCPLCQRDWEVRILRDQVTVLPGYEHGG
jgi:hypothetical protein